MDSELREYVSEADVVYLSGHGMRFRGDKEDPLYFDATLLRWYRRPPPMVPVSISAYELQWTEHAGGRSVTPEQLVEEMQKPAEAEQVKPNPNNHWVPTTVSLPKIANPLTPEQLENWRCDIRGVSSNVARLPDDAPDPALLEKVKGQFMNPWRDVPYMTDTPDKSVNNFFVQADTANALATYHADFRKSSSEEALPVDALKVALTWDSSLGANSSPRRTVDGRRVLMHPAEGWCALEGTAIEVYFNHDDSVWCAVGQPLGMCSLPRQVGPDEELPSHIQRTSDLLYDEDSEAYITPSTRSITHRDPVRVSTHGRITMHPDDVVTGVAEAYEHPEKDEVAVSVGNKTYYVNGSFVNGNAFLSGVLRPGVVLKPVARDRPVALDVVATATGFVEGKTRRAVVYHPEKGYVAIEGSNRAITWHPRLGCWVDVGTIGETVARLESLVVTAYSKLGEKFTRLVGKTVLLDPKYSTCMVKGTGETYSTVVKDYLSNLAPEYAIQHEVQAWVQKQRPARGYTTVTSDGIIYTVKESDCELKDGTYVLKPRSVLLVEASEPPDIAPKYLSYEYVVGGGYTIDGLRRLLHPSGLFVLEGTDRVVTWCHGKQWADAGPVHEVLQRLHPPETGEQLKAKGFVCNHLPFHLWAYDPVTEVFHHVKTGTQAGRGMVCLFTSTHDETQATVVRAWKPGRPDARFCRFTPAKGDQDYVTFSAYCMRDEKGVSVLRPGHIFELSNEAPPPDTSLPAEIPLKPQRPATLDTSTYKHFGTSGERYVAGKPRILFSPERGYHALEGTDQSMVYVQGRGWCYAGTVRERLHCLSAKGAAAELAKQYGVAFPAGLMCASDKVFFDTRTNNFVLAKDGRVYSSNDELSDSFNQDCFVRALLLSPLTHDPVATVESCGKKYDVARAYLLVDSDGNLCLPPNAVLGMAPNATDSVPKKSEDKEQPAPATVLPECKLYALVHVDSVTFADHVEEAYRAIVGPFRSEQDAATWTDGFLETDGNRLLALLPSLTGLCRTLKQVCIDDLYTQAEGIKENDQPWQVSYTVKYEGPDTGTSLGLRGPFQKWLDAALWAHGLDEMTEAYRCLICQNATARTLDDLTEDMANVSPWGFHDLDLYGIGSSFESTEG